MLILVRGRHQEIFNLMLLPGNRLRNLGFNSFGVGDCAGDGVRKFGLSAKAATGFRNVDLVLAPGQVCGTFRFSACAREG